MELSCSAGRALRSQPSCQAQPTAHLLPLEEDSNSHKRLTGCFFFFPSPVGRFVIQASLPLSLRPWVTSWKGWISISFTLRIVSGFVLPRYSCLPLTPLASVPAHLLLFPAARFSLTGPACRTLVCVLASGGLRMVFSWHLQRPSSPSPVCPSFLQQCRCIIIKATVFL